MKYYVISDVHGFYTEMIKALIEKGFFEDTELHKLILCGDMMDRGGEAVKMQEFMLEQLRKGDLIFTRGNHEDLILEMLRRFDRYCESIMFGSSHHVHNGTFSTALQLSGMTERDVWQTYPERKFVCAVEESPFVKELIPASVDYFETKRYVFTHGWIPTIGTVSPKYDANWRKASKLAWDKARWNNGMDMAVTFGAKVPDKTVVCGHWHTSYGHSKFEHRGSEWGDYGEPVDLSPFYADGIIALDGCVALSNKVNCIVIEDEELNNGA